jgi:hypothetical protein
MVDNEKSDQFCAVEAYKKIYIVSKGAFQNTSVVFDRPNGSSSLLFSIKWTFSLNAGQLFAYHLKASHNYKRFCRQDLTFSSIYL